MFKQQHLFPEHGNAVWDRWWDVFKNPTIAAFPDAP